MEGNGIASLGSLFGGLERSSSVGMVEPKLYLLLRSRYPKVATTTRLVGVLTAGRASDKNR